MTTTLRQYLADKAGNRIAVVLPIREYEELLEDSSDRHDIAEQRNGKSLTRPLEEFVAELAAEELVGDGAVNHSREFTVLEAAMIGAGLAQSHPQRVSGTVCFVEAPRLPIEALFANLDQGETIEEFLENYPDTITHETIEKSLAVQQRLLEATNTER